MKLTLKHLLALSIVVGASATQANAETQALNNLQAYSGVNPIQTSCATCHGSIPALNSFGSAFLSLGGSKGAGYVLSLTAQNNLLTADTDGDGTNNLAELQAGTNPAGSGLVTNTETATTTGCITSSLQMPLMLFAGLLALGFFSRRKKSLKKKRKYNF